MNLFDDMVFLFVAPMLILFFYSLVFQRSKNFKNEIVTLGVLGTFSGIYLGLQGFDVNQIEQSIPVLLEGLRLAFVTSIAGLLFFVILSVFRKEQHAGFATQFLNNQEKMIATLDSALTDIAKSSNQEIIKALEEVVKDFNSQLSTQFGENFRHLNESVHSLNEWQQNYKSEVTDMETSLKIVLGELNKVNHNLQNQQESSKFLIDSMSQSTESLVKNLKSTVGVVEESFDLLLRSANAKLR